MAGSLLAASKNPRSGASRALGLVLLLVTSGCSYVTISSVSSTGEQANGPSFGPALSANGRFAAFVSGATNLGGSDTNRADDIFVRDERLGTTERVSISSTGVEANDESLNPAISADGRYVAFSSKASNLVVNDTNNVPDIFVRDRTAGVTKRVNVSSAGVQDNRTIGSPLTPSISADGRFVAFYSDGSNLVPGDTNHALDVFVRDRTLGLTQRVSVSSAGDQASDFSFSRQASISADGRFVAFESTATNLVANDTNGAADIFVRDRTLGTTERVSLTSSGAQASGASLPSISGDGRFVSFSSFASDLTPNDTNNAPDIFVRDRATGSTVRASTSAFGGQGNSWSEQHALSADGRYVIFRTDATNLVPSDTNQASDVITRFVSTPEPSGVVPGEVARGANGVDITISGVGFRLPLDVRMGPDITVNSVAAQGNALLVNVSVDPNAEVGDRDVTVVNRGSGPGQQAGAAGVCRGCFRVL